MKITRTRVAVLIVGWAVLALFACASPRGVSGYDGDVPNLVTDRDSVMLVPVTITNDRSRDLVDPHFYLIGNGRHSLGIVNSLSTKRVFVDSRWLVSPDGTFQIIAHYPGMGDLYYEKVSWRKGESVFVTLSTFFNPVAAWSHR